MKYVRVLIRALSRSTTKSVFVGKVLQGKKNTLKEPCYHIFSGMIYTCNLYSIDAGGMLRWI